MADVAIGAQMRANLLSLQRTNKQMDTTQFNLSTGRKINSALDGAQAFFASQSLSNRASDLNRLLDSMGQSIQTIKEADKGITAMTTMVEQAEAIAQQAQEELASVSSNVTFSGDKDLSEVTDLTTLTGVTTTETFDIKVGTAAADTITITAGDSLGDLVNNINTAVGSKLTASIDSAGQLQLEATNDGEAVRIINGTLGADGLQSLGFGEIIGTENDGAGGTRTAGTIVAGSALTSTATATNASDTLHSAGFVTIGDADDVVNLTLTVDGQTSGTIAITQATTVQGLIDGINNDAVIGDKVTASFDDNTGQVKLVADSSVSSISINAATPASNDGGAATTAFGFGSGGADASLADTGESASEVITLTGGSSNISQLESDYDEIRTQIDNLVEDAHYRGTNLLEGDDLTTTFNEDGSNTLVTEGADFTASGLGLSAANFTNSASATSTWQEAKDALNKVRDFGSSIANDLTIIQTREEFTENTIQVLEEGSDKLTLADPNEEGAKMLALQTRLQLGVTSMSLASQSEQSVLSMFG